MSIKKTVRIPKSELPTKNNITKAELVDLGGKNLISYRSRYFTQESFFNAPGQSLIDTAANVTVVSADPYSSAYFVTISNLSFTSNLKLGAVISATSGTSNFQTGFITAIVDLTTITVTTYYLTTTGTITNIYSEGFMAHVVTTADQHNFAVGDDVWIEGVSKYFDGSVKISKIIGNDIYYYNSSLEYPTSNILNPTSLLTKTITNAGYIKRRLFSNQDINLENNFNPNVGISGPTPIAGISIKNGTVTITTFSPHQFIVADTVAIDFTTTNSSLYLKSNKDRSTYSTTHIYTITKIVSDTSFEFKISDTNSPTTNMTLISSSGTVTSVAGPNGQGLYTATITGISPQYTGSTYVWLSATNGTGSIGAGIISSSGTVGDPYVAADTFNGGTATFRNITGMSSTKGLKAQDLIRATSKTGSLYDLGVKVYSVVNSTSITVYDSPGQNSYPTSYVAKTINKTGTITNIYHLNGNDYFEIITEITAIGNNSINIESTSPLYAGTISNLSIQSNLTATADNAYQSVIRYTTEKPHNLTIGDNVSIYGSSPGSYNLSQYKIIRLPKDKTFDISYMSQKLTKRIKDYLGNNIPYGESPYKTDLDSKKYISSGFINNFLYYLRYRLVSSDKNKFSAWTPIIKTDHNYYDDLANLRIDGGDQSW
jgi:hypothetical protein